MKFNDGTVAMTCNVIADYKSPNDLAIDTVSNTPLTSGPIYTFNSNNGDTFLYGLAGIEHIFYMETTWGWGYVSYFPGNLEIFLSEEYFLNKSCGLCG